ncbi:MAG: hypothetical protein A3F84_20345 [Candidatus Handelsmanbacteria bacterium RIFCSPLOWO2_12_FULL_64_10]|uniref:Uncharacterized protein n=1 Tax=Handelsmanbacteria sp. (strain RIFCSPLOWO2_12_FULL_64_10) TaxID=1817868 RepID=A0A1F6CBZ5_HANXR|nr:MAG: hypothetical protein A3F84_20345 [Candidatus Handelsmanbacteria bacterium RIFCSPLOWO2_12_FULL_64_10]
MRQIVISGGVALGVLGAVIGAGVGAIRTERWERAPLEPIRMGIAPQRHGGIRLAASFKF